MISNYEDRQWKQDYTFVCQFMKTGNENKTVHLSVSSWRQAMKTRLYICLLVHTTCQCFKIYYQVSTNNLCYKNLVSLKMNFCLSIKYVRIWKLKSFNYITFLKRENKSPYLIAQNLVYLFITPTSSAEMLYASATWKESTLANKNFQN